jgi:preprotein translocase subunit YajC
MQDRGRARLRHRELCRRIAAKGCAAMNGMEGMEGVLTMASTVLPLVLMVVVFYFLLIRPQKKKEKETQRMRNSIQVGDEIVTAGGIVGLVVSIKEDTVVIETGNDRSKVRIKRWAIQSNETVHDDVNAEV